MFEERAHEQEFLDSQECDPELAAESYRFMEKVNRMFGGIRHVQEFIEAQAQAHTDDSPLRILDIGAGYGRLAHRMVSAFPNIQTYFCTDAVAISTFISEYYIRFRKLENNTKIIPLDDIESTLKKKEKLTSAIAGAIAEYIKQEEASRSKKRAGSPIGPLSIWGQSGRQDTMQLRRLFQLRITRR